MQAQIFARAEVSSTLTLQEVLVMLQHLSSLGVVHPVPERHLFDDGSGSDEDDNDDDAVDVQLVDWDVARWRLDKAWYMA